MPAPIDLTGKRFGMLTAVKPIASTSQGRVWLCRCDCGEQSQVIAASLSSGNTQSCGCRKRAVLGESTITHGMSGSRTHRIWKGMRSRCSNSSNHAYSRYGERGIKVCKRWDKFENFLADMGEAPAGKSIDRIDNSKGYSKSNCRWATPREQARNMRANRMITINGITLCLAEWAEIKGMSISALWKKLHREGG